jgi:hypothetical protein
LLPEHLDILVSLDCQLVLVDLERLGHLVHRVHLVVLEIQEHQLLQPNLVRLEDLLVQDFLEVPVDPVLPERLEFHMVR